MDTKLQPKRHLLLSKLLRLTEENRSYDFKRNPATPFQTYFEQNGTSVLLKAIQNFPNEIELIARAEPYKTIDVTLGYRDILIKQLKK